MKTWVDGRIVTAESIRRFGNCRLVATQKILSQLLMMVEEEIETRSRKGEGGLD